MAKKKRDMARWLPWESAERRCGNREMTKRTQSMFCFQRLDGLASYSLVGGLAAGRLRWWKEVGHPASIYSHFDASTAGLGNWAASGVKRMRNQGLGNLMWGSMVAGDIATGIDISKRYGVREDHPGRYFSLDCLAGYC